MRHSLTNLLDYYKPNEVGLSLSRAMFNIKNFHIFFMLYQLPTYIICTKRDDLTDNTFAFESTQHLISTSKTFQKLGDQRFIGSKHSFLLVSMKFNIAQHSNLIFNQIHLIIPVKTKKAYIKKNVPPLIGVYKQINL